MGTLTYCLRPLEVPNQPYRSLFPPGHPRYLSRAHRLLPALDHLPPNHPPPRCPRCRIHPLPHLGCPHPLPQHSTYNLGGNLASKQRGIAGRSIINR